MGPAKSMGSHLSPEASSQCLPLPPLRAQPWSLGAVRMARHSRLLSGSSDTTPTLCSPTCCTASHSATPALDGRTLSLGHLTDFHNFGYHLCFSPGTATTKAYHLTLLESRCPNPRRWGSPETPGGGPPSPLLPAFQLLVLPALLGDPWWPTPIAALSSRGFLSVCLWLPVRGLDRSYWVPLMLRKWQEKSSSHEGWVWSRRPPRQLTEGLSHPDASGRAADSWVRDFITRGRWNSWPKQVCWPRSGPWVGRNGALRSDGKICSDALGSLVSPELPRPWSAELPSVMG